jgi:hypothetical protein
MHKKLILASIALGGLAVSSYGISRPSSDSPTAHFIPAVSFVGSGLPAASPVVLAIAGPVVIGNFTPDIAPATTVRSGAETLSLISDFIPWMEPLAGFLIGALLLGIATSLRLRVIRKNQSNTELSS